MVSALVTMPPHRQYVQEVARHPLVSGLRFNTAFDVKGSLEDMLKEIKDQAEGKDVWVDLKARQLRTMGYASPPFTAIEVNHRISVETPTTVYFNDGETEATLLAIDGYKLIMQEGPRRVVGPGESLNILHPSLSIEGFLTDLDKRYIEAAQHMGINNYMLSFVENRDDVDAFQKWYPGAKIVAKIESKKGLQYINTTWDGEARLMLARGDLFVEVGKPHEIIQASEDVIKKDPSAIAASRIFSSLTYGLMPSCADINDVDNLIRMGYKTLMLGDEVCLRRESIISGLNLLEAIAEKYEK